VTLATLRTAVNVQSGLRLVDDAVNQCINQALRQIAGESDWPWLELVETGTWPAAEVLTLAAEAKAVRSVKVGDLRFDPMPEQDADLDWDERVVKGYSVSSRDLRVVPQPNAGTAYTVWYVAYENTLSADGDVPLIPAAHTDAVVYLAASMVHDRPEGDPKARERFNGRYLDARAAMLRTSPAKRGGQLARTRRDVI
jgi:hypothetical protein